MENALSYWNWRENPIMTLFPMDDVLLEIRNRKEKYCTWSFVTTTSHIRTLSMLLFQDSTDMSSIFLVPSQAIRPNLACASPTSITYTPAFCYHWARLCHFVDARTIL
jgi:hypothetical protein